MGLKIAIRIARGMVLVAASVIGLAASADDGALTAIPTVSEKTGQQAEEFLRTALMTPRRAADSADTTQFEATLSDGSSTREASVQTIDSYEYGWVESRDSFKYNVAAYRLSKMLGLEVVPCTVWRRVDGRWASVTLASEKVAGKSESSDVETIFRALTGNPSGDYADAFLATKSIHEQIELSAINPDLDRKLAELDRSKLTSELGEILTRDEIRCLLARRDRILKHCRRSTKQRS